MSTLIADSGSTKTDWALVPSSSLSSLPSQRFSTQGLNPFHQSRKMIRQTLGELSQTISQTGCPPVRKVIFYGSGVRPEMEQPMVEMLSEAFPQAEQVEAHSDLLGAAHALCGRNEGIASILGTGANSCLYDGKAIVQNTPALGYILGDEGSGAALGCRFLNALYKGGLSEEIKADFEASTGLTLTDIIDRVYHQPLANRFLASLSEFIHRHLDDEAVRQLVIGNFRDFFRKNILPYRRPDLPVGFVGSIAWHYQRELREAAAAEGFTVGTVLQSPIEGLVKEEKE